MAFVRIEQRNARLAAPVRLETVNGRDGPHTKGTVVIISNVRKGSGGDREDEATSVQWTLWGKQAENAAKYLGKGSRVNVVGRLQNNNYKNAEGETVYALTFTCEELDYLDTRLEAEARRVKQEGAAPEPSAPAPTSGTTDVRVRRPGKTARAAKTDASTDDDIPF